MKKEIETIPELIRHYKKWIILQGFTADSPKDHCDKLNRFFAFATEQGAVDEERRLDLGLCDAELLADYQTHLFEVISERTGKRLSTASQINLLSYLQSFFRFLRKTKRIATDPSEVIKLPRHSKPLPAATFTPEEVRRLLALPNLHAPVGFRDRCILEVFWATGIRLSELIALDLDDVRFDDELLRLRMPKGRKERFVPIGEGALAWLREYIDNVRPIIAANGHKRHKGNSCLFLSRFGRRLDKTSIHYKIQAYRRRAKIKKKIGTHTFRHTLATEMLKRGADLRHIQEMLGHNDLTTTQRYLHVVQAELKKVHGRTHPRETTSTTALPHYRGTRFVQGDK